MAVMRGDNITVGRKPTTSRSTSVVVEDLPERVTLSRPAVDKHNPVKKQWPEVCGAMTQQRYDSSSQSAPQEFVRLVGCRDPKIKPQPKR
jgi:hypothetical protein